MSIVLSWGRWGGFYLSGPPLRRICLGWVALTLMPMEIDDILRQWLDGIDKKG